VLRRIFEFRKDEVTRDWRKLHNEQLHNLYSSLNIVRVIKLVRMRWTEHIAGHGEMKNAYRDLVEKPEGNRALRRPMSRWQIILNWIHLAQDRDRWWALVNMVMNLQVPYNTGNFLTS
jgi:hypothetical protein